MSTLEMLTLSFHRDVVGQLTGTRVPLQKSDGSCRYYNYCHENLAAYLPDRLHNVEEGIVARCNGLGLPHWAMPYIPLPDNWSMRGQDKSRSGHNEWFMGEFLA